MDTLSIATHSIASLSAPGRQCLVDELDAQVLSAVSESLLNSPWYIPGVQGENLT
ncbi:hypothetical protein DSO57_1023205 [Entomophthora muscae]|uniref:Uncharacterized protein n=1 Tax=Entomophthora muscae TaxID=34485 RepID=A0ACC2U0Y9_9FUNG|nr:hypothetical protein DSO57_1023205 [Entomophthora muscae]